MIPYLRAAADGRRSIACLHQLELGEAPAIMIDLGSVQRINQLHLHAVDLVQKQIADRLGMATGPSTITSPISSPGSACAMPRPP